MNTQATLIVGVSIAVIFAASIIFSLWYNKKYGGGWTASKQPFFCAAMSIFASCCGGAVITFHTGLGYKYGWGALTYGIMMTGGIMGILLVAKFFRHNNFQSLSDAIQGMYGKNSALLLLTGIFTALIPFSWISTQCMSFGKTLEPLTGIDSTILIAVFCLLCLIFVLPAGYTTVIWTDTFLGCFMIVVLIVMLFYGHNAVGGWDAVMASRDSSYWGLGGFAKPGAAMIITWLFANGLVSMVQPIYIQRVASVENESKIKKMFLVTGIACIFIDIYAAIFGQYMFALDPNQVGESITGWFLTKVPTGVMAMVAALVAAAMMSTADSAVQTTTAIITDDIYKKFINPNIDEKSTVRMSRIMSVVILALSIGMAVLTPSVLDWVTITTSFATGVFLCPVYVGFFLYRKNGSKQLPHQVAIAGMLAGLAGCIFGKWFNPTAIPMPCWGVGLSLLAMVIAHVMFKDRVNTAPEKD